MAGARDAQTNEKELTNPRPPLKPKTSTTRRNAVSLSLHEHRGPHAHPQGSLSMAPCLSSLSFSVSIRGSRGKSGGGGERLARLALRLTLHVHPHETANHFAVKGARLGCELSSTAFKKATMGAEEGSVEGGGEERRREGSKVGGGKGLAETVGQ